jgi:hypothetical protein
MLLAALVTVVGVQAPSRRLAGSRFEPRPAE